jgi:hypothetical protein
MKCFLMANGSVLKSLYLSPYLARVSNEIFLELSRHNTVKLVSSKISQMTRSKVVSV